jgi:hypothetical protein
MSHPLCQLEVFLIKRLTLKKNRPPNHLIRFRAVSPRESGRPSTPHGHSTIPDFHYTMRFPSPCVASDSRPFPSRERPPSSINGHTVVTDRVTAAAIAATFASPPLPLQETQPVLRGHRCRQVALSSRSTDPDLTAEKGNADAPRCRACRRTARPPSPSLPLESGPRRAARPRPDPYPRCATSPSGPLHPPPTLLLLMAVAGRSPAHRRSRSAFAGACAGCPRLCLRQTCQHPGKCSASRIK